ncbi:hypothetical protein N7470_006938 [Penicillium chermesinum]|nr:hypothetical protein N7470_006938 [Penicillium chermesinum]
MPAAPANGRANRAGNSKNATQSLVIKLKLPPKTLRQFALGTPEQNSSSEALVEKSAERSSPASSTEVPVVRPSSADNASDADAASTPATGATPGDTPRRKGVPGPKPGNKRTNGQTEPTGRARGRPGPKKKPKTEEGTDTAKLPTTHRLGPKANTGAINAGLRALDRTGAPCRRWERQPLKLRSFTGSDDSKSAALESGDSDAKPTSAPGPDTLNGSSAVPSEKSTGDGDGDVTPAPSNLVEPSSPAIAMTA